MTDALTVLYSPRFGAVDRIMSLLRRRGFPVAGVTLERTHRPEVGRMTVSVGNPAALDQVSRHLRKLPDVLEVTPTGEAAVRREYALVRVRCRPDQRKALGDLLATFEARPVDEGDGYLVFELAGPPEELDALFAALERYGIEDAARTNPLAVGTATTNSTERN